MMTKKKPAPKKRKTGRPSLYTEALAAKICRRLAEGETLRSIYRDRSPNAAQQRPPGSLPAAPARSELPDPIRRPASAPAGRRRTSLRSYASERRSKRVRFRFPQSTEIKETPDDYPKPHRGRPRATRPAMTHFGCTGC